jgi:hypothetical protein
MSRDELYCSGLKLMLGLVEMNWQTGPPNWDMSLITVPFIRLNVSIKDTG